MKGMFFSILIRPHLSDDWSKRSQSLEHAATFSASSPMQEEFDPYHRTSDVLPLRVGRKATLNLDSTSLSKDEGFNALPINNRRWSKQNIEFDLGSPALSESSFSSPPINRSFRRQKAHSTTGSIGMIEGFELDDDEKDYSNPPDWIRDFSGSEKSSYSGSEYANSESESDSRLPSLENLQARFRERAREM
jgi:hypothetical protein